MPDQELPQSSIILYQTEDGRTRIQCRFEEETVWLTQKLIAELFQKDVRTINEHLVNIFAEGELSREATIRKFRIVRLEGSREVARELEHYNLEAILAVGDLMGAATCKNYLQVRSEGGSYRKLVDAKPRQVDAGFEKAVKQLPKPAPKPRKKKQP